MKRARGASYVETLVLLAFALGVVLGGAKVLGGRAGDTADDLGDHIVSMTATNSRTSDGTGSGANAGDTYQATNATCDSTHGCEGAPSLGPAGGGGDNSPAATLPDAPQSSPGVLDYATSFGKGVVVDGLWGTLTGLYTMVRHPITTTKGLYNAATHPQDTWNAATTELSEAWKKDPARVIGGGAFQALTIWGPGAAAKLGTAAKIGEIVSDASTADKLAEAGTLTRAAETAQAGETTTSATSKVGEACEGGVCTKLGNCFAAGTPVLTAEGERPIEDIAVGDVVLARDPRTGETKAEHVTRLFVTPDRPLVDLAIGAGGVVEHVKVTDEHPFFTMDRGFLPVRELVVGEALATALGEARVVSLVSLPERATVFNFEVEDAHTYFVGHLAAFVHNQCFEGTYEASPKHGPQQVGNIAAAPKDGATALKNSVQIKGTSPRRIGVDPVNGEIVMLPETFPGKGIFHGYVVEWSDLTMDQQNALVKAGLASRKGRILLKPP